MLLWLLRGLFVIMVIGMSVAAFSVFDDTALTYRRLISTLGAVAMLGIGGIVMFTDMYERNKQITTLSALYFGLLLGLLLGWLLSLVMERYIVSWLGVENSEPASNLVRLFTTVVCCYITISTLVQTKDEFRFIIPYVEFSKQLKGTKPLILDTSVIIDGRIADLCDTNIVDAKLIVPKFVLVELQAVADSSDRLKRNRGRRGLDMLKKMQTNANIDLTVDDAERVMEGVKGKVDERLVLYAKEVGGRVVTNDYNLNKIAQLQGVQVINLNDIANSLKTVTIPGEILHIKVVKVGEQPGQGVGYLDDGTMVVVEQGRNQVGNDVTVTVTSVLQTSAGRMIFGKVGIHTGSAEMKALDPNQTG
ncbi:MAG: PIN/TRAM domain-containing protein [Zavarzinella sp.]